MVFVAGAREFLLLDVWPAVSVIAKRGQGRFVGQYGDRDGHGCVFSCN